MKQNWTSSSNQYRSYFAYLNVHFIQLVAANTGSVALVRFQKVLMNKANGGLSNSHHNFCWYNFGFGKPICWSFALVIKDQILITIHYLIKIYIIHRCSIKHTTKLPTLWLSMSLYETHLLSFFLLSIFLRWSEIVEMLKTIIRDICLTLWRAFCSTNVFWCSFSISDGHHLPPWTSSLVTSLWNFRNQRRTIRSQV